MTPVLLIRHGRTSWNTEGRIQGQTDIPLSAAGRAALKGFRVPAEYGHLRWYASPLVRAVETAGLLGARELKIDPRLVELRWGEWEGSTKADIRKHHGDAFAENEARGLDFRPPGGESPRELRERLEDWIADVCAAEAPVVAVTHKGIIQMALALATGWDLVSRAPVRLDWTCAQHFSVSGTPPRLQLEAPNVALRSPRDVPGD